MVLPKIVALLLLGILLGCSGQGLAPVDQRVLPNKHKSPSVAESLSVATGAKKSVKKSGIRVNRNSKYYRVKKGDTLFLIAWRYNLNFKEIAKWNGIRKPYVIKTGQRLKIKKPLITKHKAISGKTQNKNTRVLANKAAKSQVVKFKKISSAKLKNSWVWPTKGKVVQVFNRNAAKKGLDISGRAGQKVVAVADGEIVFSNNNLRGYGNLIIVKHSDDLLSAYAYNNTLVVTEGDRVKQGQQIATMGSMGGQDVLHFEIRKLGKSVGPMWYLVKR